VSEKKKEPGLLSQLLGLLGPKEAEAAPWKLPKMPPSTEKAVWDNVAKFVDQLFGLAEESGSYAGRVNQRALQHLGGKNVGDGSFGSVYGFKPQDYDALAVKLGHLDRDVAYGNDVKGIPPILKEYSKGDKNAIVMPFIPGPHSMTAGQAALADVPIDPYSALDLFNIISEANKKGLSVFDAHSKNLIHGGASLRNPSTWMVDRGGVGKLDTAQQVGRRRAIQDELAQFLPQGGGFSRGGMMRQLLKSKDAEKSWPDLMELLYEAPETRRFLP
jgi:hypothetical protein